MTRGVGCRTYTSRPAPPGSSRGDHPWVQRLELERELHDGAALRLSTLSMRLGVARHELGTDDPVLHRFIDEVHEELVAALQDLRRLGSRLYPPLLHASGLATALREVVIAMRLPVRVSCTERFGPGPEGAAYFALVICLPIVTRAHSVIDVEIEGESNRLVVRLDGRDPGIDYDVAVEAVDAVSEALAAAGGSCEVVERPSPQPDRPQGNAMIMLSLPCG